MEISYSQHRTPGIFSVFFGLARQDLKNRYAGSYAGAFWNVAIPLLYSTINVIVFSILMSGRMGAEYMQVPFALFYFVPLILWSLFSDVTIRSTSILREYSYLITKIAFPFWILPIVPVASALMNQLILLLITSCLMVYHGISPASTAIVFLLLWVILLMLSIGVAFTISAISVYFPDMSQIVPVLVNVLFWLTPILYPAILVEKNGAFWVRSIIMDLNPFFYIIEQSRAAVFGGPQLSSIVLIVLSLLASFTFFIGIKIFGKLKRGFADVL